METTFLQGAGWGSEALSAAVDLAIALAITSVRA